MLAPVEHQISRDLHITLSYHWFLLNSLILIGVGLGPLILAPLSETYGRKPVLLGGSIVFIIWNTGCGASQTISQILAFRLLSGFGACVADALAGGVLADLWTAEETGRAFAIFTTAPLLGIAVGPICGAFISEGISWRWIFWVVSIASSVVTVIAILFLDETYEPQITKLRENREEGKAQSFRRWRIPRNILQAFLDTISTNLQRPLRMLGTQLIIQLLAIYMALLYGTGFLFLFFYPRIWAQNYHQSTRVGSLNYISVAVGLIAGANIAGYLNDHIHIRLKAKNNGHGLPEFRVPAMIMGTALVPIGLMLWGWSGQFRVHWIVPNLGSLIFFMGVYVCSGCVSVYTIDTYSQYAASAISTNLALRSLTAAFFPLFAPYMINRFGFGWGATVLAGEFFFLGSIVVLVLWFYGARLRARSPYCAAESV